jgi:formiminotetrahydrofolate cyclodeaminase
MLTSLSVDDFLDEIASHSPAPGGGSVSALAAALGAALTSMVCRLTIGKKKYADVQSEMEKALMQSEKLRAQFKAIIDEDTAAYNKVMAAYGLPKDTEDQKSKRTAEIQEAMKTATLVPLKLMELCGVAMKLVKIVAEQGNQSAVSDAGVAMLMLQAGCEGAAMNVKINLGLLTDSGFVAKIKILMEQQRISLDAHTSDIMTYVNRQFASL